MNTRGYVVYMLCQGAVFVPLLWYNRLYMKAIANSEQYFINKEGQVFNSKTKKFIKNRQNKRGYVQVNICGKTHYIHRLLASAYLGDVCDKQVDHIDKNKSNNNLNNLRICVRSENRANSYKRAGVTTSIYKLSLIHISEPTRPCGTSRMPSSA